MAAPPGLATTVVVGGSNPRLAELQRAADTRCLYPSSSFRDPPNVPELMARSDLAVICAGGTLWELLYMGCPSLSYVRDEVQGQIIARLHALEAVYNLGAVEEFEESRLMTAIGELAASQTGRARDGSRLAKIGGWRRAAARAPGVAWRT